MYFEISKCYEVIGSFIEFFLVSFQLGPIFLAFMGLVSLHNMHLLVICSRAMAKRCATSSHYTEVGKAQFCRH